MVGKNRDLTASWRRCVIILFERVEAVPLQGIDVWELLIPRFGLFALATAARFDGLRRRRRRG